MNSAQTISSPRAGLPSKGLQRIAVIGGGIAGLSAAWELRRLVGDRAHILVAEAYGRLGGKLKTVDFATGPVDMGAEAFLGTHRDFLDLLAQVGLKDHVRTPSELRSGLFVRGRLVDIPQQTYMGIPAEGASVRDVVGEAVAARVDAERRGEAMGWTPGNDCAVGQLVTQRLGRGVAEGLVTPLLGGVYSTSADDLGVRATLPELADALDEAGREGKKFYLTDIIKDLLARRDAARRAASSAQKGTQVPAFYSLENGFRSVVQALLQQSGAEVLYNTAVEALGRSPHGWYIEPIGVVDAVILATPAPIASVLLQDCASTASEALRSIDLASSVVVGMRFASSHGIPERSGILLGPSAPTEAKAFTFSSQKWPHLAARGGAIVRASFGTYHQPWFVEADDRALLAYALDDMHTLTGERKRPEEFFIQRWWGGIPRYGVGHADCVAEAMKDVEGKYGLALAGSMLSGVGVPATVATGRAAAQRIAAQLGSKA